jgi:hypothetical protein
MMRQPAALWASMAVALGAIVSVPGSSALSGPRIETAQIDTARLRSGDLVFRAGRGWEADAVRVMSQDSFSHVGMIERTDDGRIFVIHAAPPENGGHGFVERVPLSEFNHPRYASDIVFFRRSDVPAEAGARAAEHARAMAAGHVPFDEDFDIADSSALYCTELVLLAYAQSGSALPSAGLARSRLALIDGVVFPADLLRSDRFAEVDAVDRS